MSLRNWSLWSFSCYLSSSETFLLFPMHLFFYQRRNTQVYKWLTFRRGGFGHFLNLRNVAPDIFTKVHSNPNGLSGQKLYHRSILGVFLMSSKNWNKLKLVKFFEFLLQDCLITACKVQLRSISQMKWRVEGGVRVTETNYRTNVSQLAARHRQACKLKGYVWWASRLAYVASSRPNGRIAESWGSCTT